MRCGLILLVLNLPEMVLDGVARLLDMCIGEKRTIPQHLVRYGKFCTDVTPKRMTKRRLSGKISETEPNSSTYRGCGLGGCMSRTPMGCVPLADTPLSPAFLVVPLGGRGRGHGWDEGKRFEIRGIGDEGMNMLGSLSFFSVVLKIVSCWLEGGSLPDPSLGTSRPNSNVPSPALPRRHMARRTKPPPSQVPMS